MGSFFLFFVVSGFCSLVYEVVWLRLAMAQFGVTTPMVSIILSVFMGGLALGSWGAGALANRLRGSAAHVFIVLYSCAELVIASSAGVVPRALGWGRLLLETAGGATWGSDAYYARCGLWIAWVLLPFCLCMGATLPLAIASIARLAPARSTFSFSYLYLANVIGAAAGTLASAFVLIEILGFRGTLLFAAALNAALAAAALVLAVKFRGAGAEPVGPTLAEEARDTASHARPWPLLIAVFATGLLSMAMEVVWVRQFTPYLGNVVYAFALILAVYLSTTAVGSAIYRASLRRAPATAPRAVGPAWALLGLAAVVPLGLADPRVHVQPSFLRLLLAIAPLCAGLGFVTPLLMDRLSAGDARRAGVGYAVNIVGCILGPLVAGFGLLPFVGERAALFALALLLFAFSLPPRGSAGRFKVPAACLAGGVALLVSSESYETSLGRVVVLRDSTATVTAHGVGMKKRLAVNGLGMTLLTPITKMMAHVPLAWLDRPPRRALIVCFGMGTTFRSALSWDIDTTAVELVPSVPALFEFFHSDAQRVLASPRARIVVDDGRRFLERTGDTYDVIVIDPPPPLQAAGSSLLYSREFYMAARRRLAPGGICQQWIPQGNDPFIRASFVRTAVDCFPHVRAFVSVVDRGLHLLASGDPLPDRTASALAARLPAAAAADLVEWGPAKTAEGQFEALLSREVPTAVPISGAPLAPVLTDDRPINEYYMVRKLLGR